MKGATSTHWQEEIDITKVGKYDKFINFQKVITYDHNDIPIHVDYRVPSTTTKFSSSALNDENLHPYQTQYALKKMDQYLDAKIQKEVDEKMKLFRLRYLERVRRKYHYNEMIKAIKPETLEGLVYDLKQETSEASSDVSTQPTSDS